MDSKPEEFWSRLENGLRPKKRGEHDLCYPPMNELEKKILQLTNNGTVRICAQAVGRGFQITFYGERGRRDLSSCGLRGKCLEFLVDKAIEIQKKNENNS